MVDTVMKTALAYAAVSLRASLRDQILTQHKAGLRAYGAADERIEMGDEP